MTTRPRPSGGWSEGIEVKIGDLRGINESQAALLAVFGAFANAAFSSKT